LRAENHVSRNTSHEHLEHIDDILEDLEHALSKT